MTAKGSWIAELLSDKGKTAKNECAFIRKTKAEKTNANTEGAANHG